MSAQSIMQMFQSIRADRDKSRRNKDVCLHLNSLDADTLHMTNRHSRLFTALCDGIAVFHYHTSHEQQRVVFTQDGYHNVIFQDLNRATGEKVESGEHIAAVDQRVSWRRVSGFEVHGQGPQAPFGGSLECFAVFKETLVEVKADICLQALWKTFQDL